MFDTKSVDLIKHFLKQYPKRTALLVGLLILAGLAEGLGLVTLLPVLEVALSDGPPESKLATVVSALVGAVGLQPTLGVLLSVIVLGMALKALFLWLAAHQVGYATARIATDLRLSVIRSLVAAQWGYYTNQAAGAVANSLSVEAFRAAGAYRELCALLAGTITLAVYLGVASLISWQVATLALVGGTAILWILRRFVAMGRSAGEGQTRASRALVSRMTDALHGMKAIKAMGREHDLLPLLEREAYDLNQQNQNQVFASETRNAFQEPLVVLLIACGLYVTVRLAAFPVSNLFVLAFLFYRVVGHTNKLQQYYQTLAGCEHAFWTLQGDIESAEASAERITGSHRPSGVRTGIALEEVTFAYDDHRVLRGASLFIPAGSFVSIIGPSGSGKTTIADLIVGLREADGGRILVDGISIDEMNLRAWRHLIGYVPQEMLLFHDSVLQNVTLGDPELDEPEVWDALERADAAVFVRNMAAGIHTVVGEHGSKLSGGQRQRIAIARALVRKPQLLVLDEVTTALDPETEQDICRTLQSLAGEVTIIAISHQPALRDVAEMVYRVQLGEVTLERGSMPDLTSSARPS